MKSLSRARLLATPWTAAYQAPPSMGFSRQECCSGVPLPSLETTQMSIMSRMEKAIGVYSQNETLQRNSKKNELLHAATWLPDVAVQPLSCVCLFATPWTATRQAPLSFIISWSLLRFRSIKLVMLSNHKKCSLKKTEKVWEKMEENKNHLSS